MGPYDPPFSFDLLVDALVQHREYVKDLEQRYKRLERERDNWREMAEPGWNERERRAALDGEIRLLREQG